MIHPSTTLVSSNGAQLTFTVTGRDNETLHFGARIQHGKFSAEASASTYIVGSPSIFFDSMAEEWNGWDGEKQWADLDDSIRLGGTIDKTGHVSLRLTMRGNGSDSQLVTTLAFEAGQLERLAAKVRNLFLDTSK